MKNKALIYIAGLGVLVGLGYFGWKAWRKKHPKGETTPPTPPITDGGTTPSGGGGTTPSGGGGTTPSGGGGSTTPSNYTTNPFKTKDELLAFQNYVINTKKTLRFWVRLVLMVSGDKSLLLHGISTERTF